jgi:outer membrane cobalamin receptor
VIIRGAFLLVTMVCLGSETAPAQRVIRGVVSDSADRAVIGAIVRPIPGGIATETDHRGRFRIVDSTSAVDSVVVTRIGYLPRRVSVPGSGDVTIRLDQSPVVLATLVSIANRREESAADIAIPVISVSREVIEASGAVSLDRLLDDVPGLQQSAEPPAKSGLMIRGIGGSRVLVLVDGEPVAGALLEDRDLSRISLASVERVEVVRGPLAAIYGSEAIGGVINVVTRRPVGDLAVNAVAGIGSRGRRTALLEAGGDGPVAWQASVGHRSVDEIGVHPATDLSLQRVWDGRVSLTMPISKALRLRLDGSAMRERQRWPIDAAMNAFNDNEAISGWAELLHERVVTRTLGGGHTADLGAEASYRRIESPDRLVGGSADETGFDIWLSDAWRHGDWLVTGAARQAWSSTWGTTFTPSVTAAWQPDAALRVRGGVARGYRAPSFKETHWNFSNPTAGYEVRGNNALSPESSWQVSLGLAWEPGAGTVIDVEMYHNSLRDLIDFRSAGTSPAGLEIHQTTNVARAMTRGLDLNIQQRLGDLSIIAAWSWLHTRDLESDQPLSERIPHSIRLSARQDLGEAAVTFTGRWLSATPAAGGFDAREALLSLDVAASWHLTRQLELRGGIENLLDQVPDGWSAPLGRTARLELAITP